MTVGEWASNLARIISSVSVDSGSAQEGRDPTADSSPRARGARTREASNQVGSSSRGKSNSPKYPLFVREGGNLVKIGWSKSEKKEYEHKAPRHVLKLLASVLSKVAAGSKRITMRQVLPLTDRTNGSEVPSYQTYLCLAWLRSIGLVRQHGRQGYSIPNGLILESSVENRWQELRER
jgi:hypothetical protein